MCLSVTHCRALRGVWKLLPIFGFQTPPIPCAWPCRAGVPEEGGGGKSERNLELDEDAVSATSKNYTPHLGPWEKAEHEAEKAEFGADEAIAAMRETGEVE